MSSNERTSRLHGVSPGARALGMLVGVLMLAGVGGCQRGATPVEPANRASPSPPPAVSPPAPVPADDASPTAPVVANGSGALPRPSAAALPTPTIGASHADATSTASETPILRAVRVGQHAGHDRLVFEFDGSGLPAWRVEYVDRPVTDCGAGNTVPVAGDAWLQIRFSGANAHTPAGQPTSGPARRGVNQPTLREVVRICDFEAEVTWVAGLARPAPYTPRVLADPARLVIDIAH